MKNKNNLLLWVGGLIIVVGLLIVFVWQSGFETPQTSPLTESEPFVPPTVYYVEGATIPEGFPTGMILEKDAPYSVAFVTQQDTSTIQSFSTSTMNMMEQETVRWKSSVSVAELVKAYEAYFSKNGWIVKDKSESSSGKSQGILATKDTAEVRVSLSSQIEGTQVTVGYT